LTEATLFPKPLPQGGTIGVPAPASPQDSRSEVYRGVEWWESRGYRVKLADGIWARDDYVAGSPEGRAADLNAMFADPEVDVVQSFQGGYGSAQAIPHLDFDLIAENPKPFVGYSDITALHTALLRKTGLATFYGNGLAGVGSPTEMSDFSRERLLAMLRGTAEPEVPRDPDDPYVRTIRGGKVTAPLVGGCLWLLIQSMGTPWEFDVEGAIFFFEDVKLPPYYLDGFLTQLRQAGKLDNVAGVVVGELKDCDWGDQREASDWARSRSAEDVLEQHLEPLGVPVLYKLPLGHGKHLASIPLGVRYTLDADRKTLTLEQPPFQS
jgi:muramoyltetrapeptide carboxypeptidase